MHLLLWLQVLEGSHELYSEILLEKPRVLSVSSEKGYFLLVHNLTDATTIHTDDVGTTATSTITAAATSGHGMSATIKTSSSVESKLCGK